VTLGELRKLRRERDRLGRRLTYALEARDTAAERAEAIRRQLADVLRQLDAIEAER
jgi:hypothetical protein